MCDQCVLLQRAFTWHLLEYVLHSSISVKEKKKRKEKREKNEKWNFCFIQKSYIYMYMKNTLYIQKKKERAKLNHPWPHFLAIPNLPVQFCPFPVYPGWQLHTCDPLVLVQFAFSWQEWFPLHSSMSRKSQIPCLKSASRGCFQSFAGLREREIFVPDEKKLSA